MTAACRKYSTKEWSDLIQKWKRSGLTKKAFCEQNDIQVKLFYQHYSRQNRAVVPAAPLVPVKITTVAEGLTERRGDESLVLQLPNRVRLKVPDGASMTTLKNVLSLLGISSC